MSEPRNAPSLLGEALLQAIRQAVREEIQAASNGNGRQEGDRLLDAKGAAEILCVGEDWLYHHHKKLPFTRKLAPRVLRFSRQGIQKWLASRKVS